MIYNNLYHTIRTSKDEYYRYHIDKDCSLVEENLSSSASVHKTSILFGNVLDYSMDIDNHGNLYIIHISTSGELYFSLFSSTRNTRKLAHINLENFSIKFLTLKLVEEVPHIFYVIGKKYSSSWYLYHNFYNKNEWHSCEITNISVGKYMNPYMVDSVSNNLYIFSPKDPKDTYIIKKFNQQINSWENCDIISMPQCFNITFIINKLGTAFIYYNSFSNHNILTYVIWKDMQHSQSSWSNPILLSDPQRNSMKPAIILEKDFIHILWQYGRDISYINTDISSQNILSKNTFHKTNDEDTFNSIYLSAHISDIDTKNNYSILTNTPRPLLIINADEASIKINPVNYNEPVGDMKKRDSSSSSSSAVRQMQMILMQKDRKLMQLSGSYKKLKDSINSILENKSKLLFNKIFIPEANESEDDMMISKLNYVINSLCKEICIRDAKIDELNNKLNKQLFKKLFR